MTSWENVTVKTMIAFTRGCGIDLMKPRKHMRIFRRRDAVLAFMENSTPAQRRMFDRILPKYGPQPTVGASPR
jgi:hypothetical protein